jgi:hypothetical protein
LKGKMRLYIGLLVLGLVAIGVGSWLLAKSPPRIEIPEGSPVIFEEVRYLMRGEISYLYIYEDGSIIYIQEKGLRFPFPDHPATRTWKTGKLTTEQLDSLLAYLDNSGLDKLNDSYTFPGKPEGGGITMSDMSFTVIVDDENLSKNVTAFGYLTPDKDETYPDMPVPLNEIYVRLRALAMTTEEICQEDISS